VKLVALPAGVSILSRSPVARWAAFALLGIGVILPGCSASSPNGAMANSKRVTAAKSDSTHTISGELIVVIPTVSPTVGTSCGVPPQWGGEGLGNRVVVAGQSRATIATGSLSSGRVATSEHGLGCGFRFTVPGVPKANFYTVTVDQISSDPISYDMLEAKDWTIDLITVPPYPRG
jgi:hypothetical protein